MLSGAELSVITRTCCSRASVAVKDAYSDTHSFVNKVKVLDSFVFNRVKVETFIYGRLLLKVRDDCERSSRLRDS